jgi:SAM-dependent methyltransferase
MQNQTTNYYNTHAEALKAKYETNGPRVEDVKRGFGLIEKKDNPFVLEIGCAHGREAKEIIKYTNRYLGTDVSQGFIDLARKDVPDAAFKLVEMDTYDFPEGIDIVFAFASLLHASREQMASILKRAHAVMNPGGVFYLSLKLGEYKEYLMTDKLGDRVFYYYEPKDIITLASGLYETVYEDVQHLRGQEWFTIALKKK